MKTIILSILMLLGLSSAGLAAEDCANAEDQATMSVCAADDFKSADETLNSQYRDIVARLADNADAKGLLVAAQRAWVAFRDAECAFQTSASAGGSIYPMLHAQCMATLTTERSAAFETYLSCEEGDMSCPVPAQ